MTSVLAVYENGVLRPKVPLHLAEGQEVEVTMVHAKPAPEPISDEEITRRLKEAKTYQEWYEVTKLFPPDEGDEYDILKALEENRRWSDGLPTIEQEKPS